jgi:hypothetical protein
MEVARLQALIDQAKKNIANNMNESEEITEKQSPAQKAAFAKMLAAKNGKKDDTVEETEETEKTVEENLKKAEEQINELKEDCGCGHGSDCDCGPECDCGCNAVNEERVDEIVPLIIGGLARAAIGSVAKKAIGGVAKAAVGAVGNAASNSGVNASKKSKGKKLNAVKNEETVKEDKSMTDGTIKKLQYLVDTNHDVYEEMGDIFGMFGSPYTADEWLSHMKLTIDEVFTKEGSPIPPEVAKVYNDLEAYSKQTELQAKRRANTEISSPNDAIYGPENEDEVYIRDNFAEQWYDAFYKVEGRLGLEQDEDFDESSDMDRLKKLSGVERESQINEDESVWNQFKELHDKMDPESEDRIFFSMKNYPKHRFEIHGDIDGKDTKSGNVNVGVFLDQQTDNGDDFLQNMSISQDEIKANITGAGWVGSDPAKGELKGTAGDYKEFGDVKPETSDADQDRLAKLSGINASKKYY